MRVLLDCELNYDICSTGASKRLLNFNEYSTSESILQIALREM